MSLTPPAGTSNPVLSKVLTIAADVFEVPQSSIGPDSSPDTISTWDSLHHLNFVLALEDGFGVQFTPEEIEQLLSIELTKALVEEKLKGTGTNNGC
jgi:acyl carrier protein